MSALGQKQTLRHLQPMSALPPKADIGTQSWNVRFVPKADIGAATLHARSDMCGLLFARCMRLLWGKADMPSRFGATVVAVITQRRKQDDASLLRNARFLRTPIFFDLAPFWSWSAAQTTPTIRAARGSTLPTNLKSRILGIASPHRSQSSRECRLNARTILGHPRLNSQTRLEHGSVRRQHVVY